MFYDSWTCLMVNNGYGPLPDELCAALKLAACNLAVKKQETILMSNNFCTGVLTTKWTSHTVGARSGILFRAHVDTPKGELKVNFLLNEDDLKRGAEVIREMEEGRDGVWVSSFGHIPDEELSRFYDLNNAGSRRFN